MKAPVNNVVGSHTQVRYDCKHFGPTLLQQTRRWPYALKRSCTCTLDYYYGHGENETYESSENVAEYFQLDWRSFRPMVT